jgi:hypothetical protein
MSLSGSRPEAFGETRQEVADFILRGLLFLQHEAYQAQLKEFADIIALAIEDCLSPSNDVSELGTRQ